MYELIAGLLFASALAAAVVYFRRKVKLELQPVLDLQKAINAMPHAEAIASAEDILKGEEWYCTAATKKEIQYGPLSNQFYSHYESVSRAEVPDVDLQLPSPPKYYCADYLEIGIEMVDGLVLMNVKDDSIVVLDRGENIEEGMWFKSIYHYLVFNHRCDDSEDEESSR